MSRLVCTCGHPFAIHLEQGCRLNRCPCEGYDDGTREAKPRGPRRVSINVPDGYVLSIQLAPIEGMEHDAGEAMDAITSIEDTRNDSVLVGEDGPEVFIP